MCRLLKSISVQILLKLTLMESWNSHLHKHASHIAHPPNTLNCRIVATLLRLHWTSLNPHRHTLITLMLAESFLDSSYSKLWLTHSPAYPPLHLYSHLKNCCYITLTLAQPFPDFSYILKTQTYSKLESFLDSSYSKLRLTHSPAYPPNTYTLTWRVAATSHSH